MVVLRVNWENINNVIIYANNLENLDKIIDFSEVKMIQEAEQKSKSK